MFTKLKDIQTLIRTATRETYTLAGGCVRDASLGVMPKDYDAVLCCGNIDDAEAFALLETHLKRFNSLYDANVEIYMAYYSGVWDAVADDFTERLYACGKVKFKDGTEVDLLLDRAYNMDDVVAGYDCNMNQVYLTDNGPSQEFPKELVFNEYRITGEARDTYMREKFAKLTNKEI